MKKKVRLDRLEEILVINEIHWQSEVGILYPYKDGREYHQGKNARNAGSWGLE